MLEIRAFRQQDRLACIELFIQVFCLPPWNDQWSLESAGDYLDDIVDTPGFFGVVGYNDGKLMGVCLGHRKRWWQGDEYHIEELFVAPRVQRRGIGRQIVEYARQELHAAGIGRVTLLTARGTPADRFYNKLGFTRSERLVFMKLDLFENAERKEQISE
ncbi:MAG: GNAT family N-acetyltransferase [Anaerolineae bacterium]|nr:GNAT family N-acetyltransferase [Anaerolineae bacterium]